MSLNAKQNSFLVSMIEQARELIDPPPDEGTTSEIQGKDLVLTVRYTSHATLSFSGNLQYFQETIKTNEEALWFLDVVESAIVSPEVTVDVDEIAEAIDEARKGPHTTTYTATLRLKGLLDLSEKKDDDES